MLRKELELHYVTFRNTVNVPGILNGIQCHLVNTGAMKNEPFGLNHGCIPFTSYIYQIITSVGQL